MQSRVYAVNPCFLLFLKPGSYLFFVIHYFLTSTTSREIRANEKSKWSLSSNSIWETGRNDNIFTFGMFKRWYSLMSNIITCGSRLIRWHWVPVYYDFKHIIIPLDKILPEATVNSQVYNDLAQGLVHSAMEGFNGEWCN